MFSQDSKKEHPYKDSADSLQSSARPGTTIKGRLFTNDFARYLKEASSSRPRAYSFSESSTLSNTTRSLLFRIGQDPVSQNLQTSLASTETPSFGLSQQIGIHFSPMVLKKPTGLVAPQIISSAEKCDRSPLQQRSPLQEGHSYVRSSGWVLIDPKIKKESLSKSGLNLTPSNEESLDFLDQSQQSLDLEHTAQKPYSKKRKASPKNSAIKKQSAKQCAQRYVETLRQTGAPIPVFLTDPQEQVEWAHIVAKTIDTSRAADPKNLVVMTKTLNTWMLFFETIADLLAKSFEAQGITVKVRSMVEVFPENEDIAKTLQYQIRCYKQDGVYIELEKTFNLERDSHKYMPPRFTDKYIVCEAFADILDKALLQKTTVPGSRSSQDLLSNENQVTQAIEKFQDLIGFVCVFTTRKRGSSIHREKSPYLNAFDLLLSQAEQTVLPEPDRTRDDSFELHIPDPLTEVARPCPERLHPPESHQDFLDYANMSPLIQGCLSPLVSRPLQRQDNPVCASGFMGNSGSPPIPILFSPLAKLSPFSEDQSVTKSVMTQNCR